MGSGTSSFPPLVLLHPAKMVAEKVKESTDISEARLLRYWKEAAPRFETEENSDILPETNIFAPENGGPLEKESPIGNHHF